MRCQSCAFPLDLTRNRNNFLQPWNHTRNAQTEFQAESQTNVLFQSVRNLHPKCVEFYCKQYPQFINKRVRILGLDCRLVPHSTVRSLIEPEKYIWKTPIQLIFDLNEMLGKRIPIRFQNEAQQILTTLINEGAVVKSETTEQIGFILHSKCLYPEDSKRRKLGTEVDQENKMKIEIGQILAKFCSCENCSRANTPLTFIEERRQPTEEEIEELNFKKIYFSKHLKRKKYILSEQVWPAFIGNIFQIEVEKSRPANKPDSLRYCSRNVIRDTLRKNSSSITKGSKNFNSFCKEEIRNGEKNYQFEQECNLELENAHFEDIKKHSGKEIVQQMSRVNREIKWLLWYALRKQTSWMRFGKKLQDHIHNYCKELEDDDDGDAASGLSIYKKARLGREWLRDLDFFLEAPPYPRRKQIFLSEEGMILQLFSP